MGFFGEMDLLGIFLFGLFGFVASLLVGFFCLFVGVLLLLLFCCGFLLSSQLVKKMENILRKIEKIIYIDT